MAEHRLLPGAIVDPEEADEPMRGSPIARAMSHDGRWAFTLYDDSGGHPFIHALDTVAASAKCIDLDQLAGFADLFSLRLVVAPDGAVVVRQPGQARPLHVVDARTFEVRDAAPARPRAAQDERGGGPTGWLVVAAGLSLVGFIGVVRAAGARSARADTAR